MAYELEHRSVGWPEGKECDRLRMMSTQQTERRRRPSPLAKLRRRLAYTDYWKAVRYEREARFGKLAPGTPLLAIYQMGQVGSSSVYEALKAALPERLILHLHSLTPEVIARGHETYARAFPAQRWVHTHLLDSEHLRGLLQTGSLSERLPVVTLVRDPVARNISNFFHRIGVHSPELRFHEKVETQPAEELARELVPLFLEQFNHERSQEWLDAELKTHLGVDVLAQPFERSGGFGHYRGERADVLLLKTERLGDCASEAFRQLLGAPGIRVPRVNDTDRKAYAAVYREFRRIVELPESYLDRLYGGRLASHFYSDEELAAFRSRWRSANR